MIYQLGNWTYRWYGGCICDPSTGCTIQDGCKECGIEIDHAIDEDSGIWIFNQATVEVVVRGILKLLKLEIISWSHVVIQELTIGVESYLMILISLVLYI